MPIYEYCCPKCNAKFEQLRPISKSEENCECPKCKTPSRRAVSKFVARSGNDFSFLNHMPPSGGGGSCSGCSSSNCSTCGH